MKKEILSAAMLLSVSTANAEERVTNYNFDKFKAHIFTSTEAMGDVSIVIEGKERLVVIEPQSFYKSIELMNSYINSLEKPIEKIVANYHAGGLAECDADKVVMVEPMVDFMKGEMAQGMMKNFDGAFGGAMDTRSVEIEHTIPTTGVQNWAGIEFNFTNGATSDFPASSIIIGGELYYSHFAPNRVHLSPLRIHSSSSIDAILADLHCALNSGCKLFVGSHGSIATIEDVEFVIGYFERAKNLLSECNDATSFVKALLAAFPELDGADGIETVAKNLYQ